MPSVRVWFHQAAVVDSNGWPIPVLSEPSLNTPDTGAPGVDEAIVVVSPGATPPAPEGTEYVFIETDGAVTYTVRLPGQTHTAGPGHKPVDAAVTTQIAVRPGSTIHFT